MKKNHFIVKVKNEIASCNISVKKIHRYLLLTPRRIPYGFSTASNLLPV